jgi:hypothetical protein
MLNRLFSLFESKTGIADTYQCPTLHGDREALDRFTVAELEPLERAFERLESRNDWDADHERERLRPLLTAAYAKRDAWLRRIAVETEREQILAELIPVCRQELTALKAALTAITGTIDTPNDEQFLELRVRNRRVEDLRHVVHDATNSAEFRDEFDAVLKLRRFWKDQNAERERLFDRLLTPGHRPRGEPPPWQPLTARLIALRTSNRPEETHAVR